MDVELEVVLDALPQAAALLDGNAAVVVANRKWRALSERCPFCAALGESYIARVEAERAHAPDASAALARVVRSALAGTAAGEGAGAVDHGCGATEGAVFASSLTPLDGRRGVLIVQEDVTELRRAHRNERRLGLAFEGTNDGVFDWNIATGEVYGSTRLYEMLGYAPGEIEPHVRAWEVLTHPDDIEGAQRAIAEHIRGKTPAYRAEMRMRCKSGDWLWVLDRGKVVERDERGRALRMSGTHTDISERKRMELQLLVSDRMASLGMLAACVAHEINSPLASALGSLEIATADVERAPSTPAANLGQALALARESLRRVMDIVRDLRAFSHFEEADRREPVDVREILDGAIRLAQREIVQRARLERSYEDVGMVNANASRLGQVFLNLLVNAAHAIRPGEPSKNRILVSVANDADRVLVDISDTGEGMPPAVARRVFEPFFTTKPGGAGVGLGLSICQAIIAGLGGDISVSSEVGVGTSFRVILPAARLASRTGAEPAHAAPREGAHRRVLVVDDEAGICLTMRLLLGDSHHVVTATSVEEARGALRTGPPFDAIFCDLMMPGTTGMELYEEVRRSWPGQAERMIFMTGGVFTPEARAFLDAVSNPVVEKPFEIERIQSLVADG